ncbi:MAG: HDOD domain-containing protein [Chromatiales bacterium]|jgi:HD-like signal output (HDOD) protein
MTEQLSLEQLVEGVDELLSLPDVVLRANELIDSQQADIDEIAEVIGLDPSLSAQLLKLVNSAFYNFPSRIDTISRAVTVIGVNELRSLILSASAVSVFNKIAPGTIDMDDFWFRSVYVGLAAKEVAADKRKAELMFLMGLLHDVGKIVLFNKAPDLANRVLGEAQQTGRPLHLIEKEQLGYSSTDISAELLKSWHVAESLWQPIGFMYDDNAPAEYARDSRILRLSTRLADCNEPEVKNISPDKLGQLKRDDGLLQSLSLNQQDIDDITEAVSASCFEVLNVINPDSMLVF